jgi:hypothetical protein
VDRRPQQSRQARHDPTSRVDLLHCRRRAFSLQADLSQRVVTSVAKVGLSRATDHPTVSVRRLIDPCPAASMLSLKDVKQLRPRPICGGVLLILGVFLLSWRHFRQCKENSIVAIS